MKKSSLLILSLISISAYCQPAMTDHAARVLAIKTQNTLNEWVPAANNPSLMADTKQLKTVHENFKDRRIQWPSIMQGPDPYEAYDDCKEALEKASYVAELSHMKAVSGLEDKVFNLEKGKLQTLRNRCAVAIKTAGKL